MPDIADIFLNDTAIPDVFITDYMSALSHQALQVYLMAKLYQTHDCRVESKPVRQALGLSQEDFKAAICELAGHQIVTAETDFSSFVLVDLKKQQLSKHYRRLTASSMQESVERNETNQDRQRLISSINDTYFHGLMGPTWYQTIDTWFDQYGFDPTVIYQMFVDAAERNVLNGPNYLNKVAEDYNKHGVKSFMDLTRYKEENKRVRLIANQIGRKLNKTITAYDLTIIEKWVIEFGYDFEVIDIALAYAVRISEPNLNYFDRILTNWHEAGIRTAKEAKQLEENNAKHNQEQRKKLSGTRKAATAGNFEQREYEDEYLAQFYEYAYLEKEEAEGE